jgi:glycopeptide antibiotics resistance protein
MNQHNRLNSKFWIFGGIFFIVMLTLFPFKFQAIAWGKKDAIKEFFRNSSDSFDFFGNIFLFSPFGYGLSQWLKPKQFAIFRKLILILGISFALTLTIESLQLFLPNRSTSAIDLFTNTVGGTLGGAYGLLGWQRQFISIITWLKKSWSQPKSIVIVLLVWISLMFGSTWQLTNMMHLNEWNPEFNLVVGNEATGDRGWQGNVKGLSISDRALSEPEINQLLQSSQFPKLDSPLADYDLTGIAPYTDRSPLALPPLEKQSIEIGTNQDQNQSQKSNYSRNGAKADHQNNPIIAPWYRTSQPPTELTKAIRKTSAFTLATTFETSSLEQTGPARIISLSLDSYQRNVTLGQQNNQLIARIRTPATGFNGAFLAIASPKKLELNRSHRAILTYQNATISLYLDQTEPSYIKLRPEVTFFHLIFPTIRGEGLPTGPKALNSYPMAFYLIWFVPLGILLGRIITLSLRLRKPGTRNKSRLIYSLAGITIGVSSLIMALLLTQFSPQPIWIGIACFGFGFLPIVVQLLHPIFKFRQAK